MLPNLWVFPVLFCISDFQHLQFFFFSCTEVKFSSVISQSIWYRVRRATLGVNPLSLKLCILLLNARWESHDCSQTSPITQSISKALHIYMWGEINYHMLQGTLELCTDEGNMGNAFLVEYLHFNNPHSARLFNTSNEQDVLPAAIGQYCFTKGNKLCLINDDQMNKKIPLLTLIRRQRFSMMVLQWC